MRLGIFKLIQYIGFGRLQQGQGHFAIGRFAAKFKPMPRPAHIISNTLSGDNFIFNASGGRCLTLILKFYFVVAHFTGKLKKPLLFTAANGWG
jgi:hypothetical protein